ncbi:MAG TPA: trigger factor [Candidatus Aquicultor sp.]
MNAEAVKTNVEKLDEKNTVLLKVEVPANLFGKAVDSAYKKIASQVSIPGFRKGKVPKSIIDSRVGKEAVTEEALQSALPSYYFDAVKSTEVEPVDQPEVDLVQVEPGKPLVFTAKVKVKPEVKLGEYKGLTAEKPSTEPTEEETSQQLESIRSNFGSLEPVEDRAAKGGDFALINFEGFINDEPFEGGSAEDYLLEIGSGTFIPGFEDQVIGVKKGEIKDITVTFPEEYGNEELAGKEARFRVLLKEIKEKKLPEIDDDFAKQVGFDTADELHKEIAEKIREQKAQQADTTVRNELIKEAADNADVELHDVMIESELDEMVEDFAHDLQRQGFAQFGAADSTNAAGSDLERALAGYLAIAGKTIDELRNDWREGAINRVKSRLVLEAIAQAENIEVTPEEVDNEIEEAAEAAQHSFDEVKRIFEERGTLNVLKNRLLIDKTINWLESNADIKEEKPESQAKGKTKKARKESTKETAENEEKIQEDKGTE